MYGSPLLLGLETTGSHTLMAHFENEVIWKPFISCFYLVWDLGPYWVVLKGGPGEAEPVPSVCRACPEDL